MILNAIRAHCAEFGVIVPQGPRNIARLVDDLNDDDIIAFLPNPAQEALTALLG